MSSQSSTSLINRTDDYSVGVSPIDFTQRWNLSPSETRGAEPISQIVHWTDFNDSHFLTSDRSPERSLQKRLMCYRILDVLPDHSIEEALESLYQIYQFYKDEIHRLPEPQRRKTELKAGPVVERPDFYIDVD